MNKETSSINLDRIQKQLRKVAFKIVTYRSIIFLLVLASLYGFILWRINVLSSAPPSQADLSSAEKQASSPHISESVVQKIKSLQDNSVNVQTLFDQARNNPFNE